VTSDAKGATSAERAKPSSRRFFAPEVVQTSAMDCGPASLKCLLTGFDIRVSYGRLREACQTDVDGSSIDTMEEVANQLGLEADQVLIPRDHLILDESGSFPALVVVSTPNGLTHFVVAWSRHGPLLQVMDPAIGRRWMRCDQFIDDVYVHTMAVPADAFRDWAASEGFLAPLRRRLSDLGLGTAGIQRLLAWAREGGAWTRMAALDAATRMATALRRAGAIERGPEAGRWIEALTRRVDAGERNAIPDAYWFATPAAADDSGEERVTLRGVVLLQVHGRREKQAAAGGEGESRALSPELVAALAEQPARPGLELLRLLSAGGALAPSLVLSALFFSAVGLLVEAVLLRGSFEIGRDLGLPQQRLGAVAALGIFLLALLLIELPVALGALSIGRHLETRLRVAFLRKIPRLGDRYFQSRLMSDMAERSHSVHGVRLLPALASDLLRCALQIVLTTAGIIWLDPRGAWLALAVGGGALALPLLAQPLLTERDLRVRTHSGALGRFYLDALLGVVAVRAHGAETSVRREHEALLSEWARAVTRLARAALGVEAFQSLTGFTLAAWLLVDYVRRPDQTSGVLLLAYWALELPVLGRELATLARQIPARRNVTLRVLEPLGAPEPVEAPGHSSPDGTPPASSPLGVRIAFDNVTVRAGGHTILENVALSIEPGAHVAIVGPSGSGKSSLVGLLLGWHRASEGTIHVDGLPLGEDRLQGLRRQTAWVDPAVHLFNARLLDNLYYGAPADPSTAVGRVIEAADLRRVLERLPDGLQTRLGEGGGLVSGGEGQRVRFGRAIAQSGVRLAVLDEPFRGLDRDRRRALLARSRELWRGSTMLCVTHDVGETRDFDRVIVIENGRVVEDGAPLALAASPSSRYGAMIEAENGVRQELWSSKAWRRLRVDGGHLIETAAAEEGADL
jgi:ABC-type bacteriocin/lantibiotic exporter with double-glycine peptidase domain